MDVMRFAKDYLDVLKGVLDQFDYSSFDKVVSAIMSTYTARKEIFIMGNGGSASTASHFACDLNKGCSEGLDKRFKVHCLNDNIPTMLALANDISYGSIFVEQLKGLFNPGDLVIGISGSGHSENVLRAIRYAIERGGMTVGFSGFSGGRLSELVDIPLVVPISDMQKVEDVHMVIVHMIMQAICKMPKGKVNGGTCYV